MTVPTCHSCSAAEPCPAFVLSAATGRSGGAGMAESAESTPPHTADFASVLGLCRATPSNEPAPGRCPESGAEAGLDPEEDAPASALAAGLWFWGAPAPAATPPPPTLPMTSAVEFSPAGSATVAEAGQGIDVLAGDDPAAPLGGAADRHSARPATVTRIPSPNLDYADKDGAFASLQVSSRTPLDPTSGAQGALRESASRPVAPAVDPVRVSSSVSALVPAPDASSYAAETSSTVPAEKQGPVAVAAAGSLPGLVGSTTEGTSAGPARGELLAGPARGRVAGEVEGERYLNKKLGELNGEKRFKESDNTRGIVSAYGVGTMPSAPAPSLNAHPDSAPASPGAPAPAAGEFASAAVRLAERVADVADRIRETPAERVTLSLDLDETHRVEVRVSLREGRVFAEFRSDSPAVRAALSSAWDGFAARRDVGAPTWGEPVFVALGAGGATAAPLDSARPAGGGLADSSPGFGREQAMGDGDSRRHGAGQPHPEPDARAAVFSPSSGSSSRAAAPVPPSPTRDRSRLLSVHA